MSKPVVADLKPKGAELEAGKTYAWCACGRSDTQPFCDGSHVGTGLEPKAFRADASKTGFFCMCRQTGSPPFCDGTHARLPEDALGTEREPETPAGSTPPAKPTPEEPTVAFIHELARDGLSKLGHHGPMAAMGVPRKDLPHWDDIQVMVAQLARKPLLDDAPVGTELVIGPEAKKPLTLSIPLFVSDMSFGALSEEAKVALAQGAELAGTGICSGEGGMLPDEQEAIATQDPELRRRLDVDQGARKLANFLGASVELMQVLARACGHSHLRDFCQDDLATWSRAMADLSGVRFGGVNAESWTNSDLPAQRLRGR